MRWLIVFCFLLLFVSAYSQRCLVSIAAGPALVQSTKHPKGDNHGYLQDMAFFTYQAGLKASISVHKKWDIRTGLLMTEVGYANRLPLYLLIDSFAFPTLSKHGTNTLSAVRLPLSLAYRINKYVALNAGIGMDLRVIRYEVNRSYKSDFPVQAGITLGSRNLSVDLSYMVSTRAYGRIKQKETTYSFYNRQLCVLMAYAINGKGKNCVPCNRRRL